MAYQLQTGGNKPRSKARNNGSTIAERLMNDRISTRNRTAQANKRRSDFMKSQTGFTPVYTAGGGTFKSPSQTEGYSRGEYTVRSGDTLGNIANQMGVDVMSLARANGISDPDTIMEGQRLTKPGEGSGTKNSYTNALAPKQTPYNPNSGGGGGSFGGGGTVDYNQFTSQNAQGAASQDAVNGYVKGLQKKMDSMSGKSPKLPSEVDLDDYKVERATIKDLEKKFGFDYSRNYSERIAEQRAQKARDDIKTSRERGQQETEGAKEELNKDFFQQFRNTQQDSANRGLNAGLGEERNIRLDMNRQDAMSEILANQQLRNQELDRNLRTTNDEAKVYAEQLYQNRMQQAFDQIQQLTGSERDYAMQLFNAANQQRKQKVDELWRQFDHNNISASDRMRIMQDAEQFGMQQAWEKYKFDNGMAFDAGMAGGGGNFSGGGASGGLGALSHKYESGGDPGAIGYDRTGGASYGTYQIASRTGTMNSFLSFLGKRYPQFRSSLSSSPGSGSFNSAWKNLAKNKQFAQAQHNFIKSSHYDPARQKIENSIGINFSKYPKAVHDVLWSTAVQHGSSGASRVFRNAGVRPGMSSGEIIRRVYSERGAAGGTRYFGSSTPAVRRSVVNRFKREKQDALNML